MVYTIKKEPTYMKEAVALDDMVLTKEEITSAGSKMLENYVSLFDATVVEKLSENYEIIGKISTSEFALGMFANSAVDALNEKEIKGVVGLETNGAYIRSAAVLGKVFVKPTYGTVSRFGIIPVACSGDTVGVMANSESDCQEILETIAVHDDKDGTSLQQSKIDDAKKVSAVKKVAIIKSLMKDVSDEIKSKINETLENAKKQGVEIVEVEGDILLQAKIAWAILSSAEFCNNVSRYDGVKYGYRAKDCKSIEDIYVKSRTEAFGQKVKTLVLYGSHVLSTDNYEKMYDKALRVRRLIRDFFDNLFSSVDAVILPACSSTEISEKADAIEVYKESKYTSPSSISGLPVVVSNGVQWVGKPFAEGSLLAFCKQLA